MKKQLDYTEYGGALLLGTNAGVIKAHGSSNAKAVQSAIGQAREFARLGIVEKIKQELAEAAQETENE